MTKSATKLFRGAIMGAPGSGKGTVSEKIVDKFDVTHISTGDILRQNIIGKTKLGLTAKKYISDGKLVPDVLVNQIVLDKVRRLSDKNWLLDGYPRTHAQAEKLFMTQPLNLVINLNVPFDVIIERLKNRLVHIPSGRVYNLIFSPPKSPGKDDVTGEPLSQRPDDQPESIKKRLEVYTEVTLPLLQFYKKHGILKDFKGTTTEAIWPDVEKELRRFMEPNV